MNRSPTFRAPAALASLVLAALIARPAPASAFCGFYVGGADQRLYANATLVVLMRDGNRTILSMQNDYQGPPSSFAMVIPVPVVLSERDVRTLPREVFDRVDQLAAPRLVEYWEQDPCYQPPPATRRPSGGGRPRRSGGAARAEPDSLGVRVEAQFAVAEYDIVILSARDSSGLETWLHQEHYNIPEGAGEVLRPYVESGTKFFVARVDPTRVTFENGRAVLSPLRFHYDTPEFSLPVRLGLLSSQGEQDLLVHILARNQRYEVANYANTFIPTNIRVRESVRDHFGAFYESVFRETVARNPRTVVTEYAWDASTCDPCPGPSLGPSDLATLGADTLTDGDEPVQLMVSMGFVGAESEVSSADGTVLGRTPLRTSVPAGRLNLLVRGRDGPPRRIRLTAPAGTMVRIVVPRTGEAIVLSQPGFSSRMGGFTLTRLHYRYTRETLGEDLVFRAAPPVVGGRGMPDTNGAMEQAVQASSSNSFQGRYAMLHPWTGPVACAAPRRGLWGGPPGAGRATAPMGAGSTFARGAASTAPPTLASVVEGTLAWAPTTGIQGMAASALVATQDAPALVASPPVIETTPPPNAPPPAPSRAPLANEPAATPAAPTGGWGCRAGTGASERFGMGLALCALLVLLARGRN